MYNRYIPQADGSFQRNRIPDSRPPASKPSIPTVPPVQKEDPPPPPPPKKYVQPSPSQPTGILHFFRQLLPKNLDTADLLIILLLLLMAGDNEEEKSNALLTMALYFLM